MTREKTKKLRLCVRELSYFFFFSIKSFPFMPSNSVYAVQLRLCRPTPLMPSNSAYAVIPAKAGI